MGTARTSTGTIAQATNNTAGVAGMAFNVSIMPIKALFTDWDQSSTPPTRTALRPSPAPFGTRLTTAPR